MNAIGSCRFSAVFELLQSWISAQGTSLWRVYDIGHIGAKDWLDYNLQIATNHGRIPVASGVRLRFSESTPSH